MTSTSGGAEGFDLAPSSSGDLLSTTNYDSVTPAFLLGAYDSAQSSPQYAAADTWSLPSLASPGDSGALMAQSAGATFPDMAIAAGQSGPALAPAEPYTLPVYASFSDTPLGALAPTDFVATYAPAFLADIPLTGGLSPNADLAVATTDGYAVVPGLAAPALGAEPAGQASSLSLTSDPNRLLGS